MKGRDLIFAFALVSTGGRADMSDSESGDLAQNENDPSVREVWANGVCMQTSDVEAKLDEGNIQEAESALRDGLSLNFEVWIANVICPLFL